MIDLEAIKARLSAATPGPWRRDGNHRAKVRGGDGDTLTRVVPESSDEPWSPTDEANADLIAHAPGDIAALVAEVERLRADNARIMLEAERHRRIADEAIERIESAEEERAAVVAWLREWQNTMDDRITHDDLDYAIAVIERGEHRQDKP